MKIGEVARLTGVSARSLRHYEAEGLVEPGRCSNGYRDYCGHTVDRVRQVHALIEAGLPARIIRDVLPHLDGHSDLLPASPCEHFLAEVARQKQQLDNRIAILSRNRDALAAYLESARSAA
ncbi:MAG: MerR family transcriptional regulator [Hamadaea sp.]|nr:MerR family transcriptional regulator [Hamadaea sp.]